MGQLCKETFVCLDCESTGLDPKTDRIIEIALILFSFEQTAESFETLVDPKIEIPEASRQIHHISQEMVQGKPSIQEVLPSLLKKIQGHTIVGHGIQFDMTLIAEEAKRHRIPCSIQEQPYLDTLRLARLYGDSPTNSLEQLRNHFNIPEEGAHRAMNDVLVNIEVFKRLCEPYRTTKQLFEVLQKPILLRTMPLGKHKGRRFDEIPLEYLRWAERKNFDQDLLFSIRIELKARKKGGGFEQAGNPFTNL